MIGVMLADVNLLLKQLGLIQYYSPDSPAMGKIFMDLTTFNFEMTENAEKVEYVFSKLSVVYIKNVLSLRLLFLPLVLL